MGTVRTTFTGPEVAKVLIEAGYTPTNRTGSHLTVGKPVEGKDEDYRRVTIPIHPGETIPVGTLRDIADDAGANDFERFCRWIDNNS